MNIYAKKSYWKIFLFLAATFIVLVSLWFSRTLAEGIAKQEQIKVDLIAKSHEQINKVEDSGYRGFLLELIKENKTVPVILADKEDNILAHRNVIEEIDRNRYLEDEKYAAFVDEKLKDRLAEMKSLRDPEEIVIFEGYNNYIYFDNSILYKQLSLFPYVQFFFLFLFLGIAYFLFSTSRKAEQNQVWVGMSKETAHQLGTPISSMMGWMEYIKSMGNDVDLQTVVPEMTKDVARLEQIAERFSKIGSEPDLSEMVLSEAVLKTFDYIKKRSSENVSFGFHVEEESKVFISPPLFSWVIENILKNALNAIQGKGEINVNIGVHANQAFIDIKDSGKGIAKSDFKTVFKPGYTTRQRGWGLGLSLTKRIIEEYHQGRVFVKESTLGKGSTFRIFLKK